MFSFKQLQLAIATRIVSRETFIYTQKNASVSSYG